MMIYLGIQAGKEGKEAVEGMKGAEELWDKSVESQGHWAEFKGLQKYQREEAENEKKFERKNLNVINRPPGLQIMLEKK